MLCNIKCSSSCKERLLTCFVGLFVVVESKDYSECCIFREMRKRKPCAWLSTEQTSTYLSAGFLGRTRLNTTKVIVSGLGKEAKSNAFIDSPLPYLAAASCSSFLLSRQLE